MSSEWPVATIGDLAADDDGAIAIGPFGSSMKAEVYTATGIPVVRGNNLTGQPGFYGELVFVPKEIAARLARCIVRPGDLVFPHRGAIGEVGLVTSQGYEEWMLSTSMMKLRAHPEKLDPHFAFYYFRSPAGRHQLLRNASQVGTPGISQPLASLRACEIALPPLREQRSIVEVLQALDCKIEQNRRTGRALEALARATFKAWFVDFEPVKAKAAGQTGFPGLPAAGFAALPDRLVPAECGPIPEDWSLGTLADVCLRITSGGTPRTEEPSFWGGALPWLSSGETRDAFIIETEKRITEAGVSGSSTRLVRAGSTVIASAGQGKTRGQTALLFIDAYINQSVLALEANRRASDFFLFLSVSPQYEELRRISDAHSSRGSLTKGLVGSLPVTIPPQPIVTAFDAVVSPMFELIRSQLEQSRTLAALRDYLLPRLLSGRVRVRDAAAAVEQAA